MSTPSVFISYRIADTLKEVDRLAADLHGAFGKEAVYFDRRTIEPADVWDEDIKAAVQGAKLVLVLIGEKWFTEQNQYGERRLDLPDDWVRREVEEALSVKGRTMPLLLDGATPPPKEAFRSLPTLKKLPRCQAPKRGQNHPPIYSCLAIQPMGSTSNPPRKTISINLTTQRIIE